MTPQQQQDLETFQKMTDELHDFKKKVMVWLEKRLETHLIRAKVTGRLKTLDSLAGTMEAKKKPLTKFTDLVGIRVSFDTLEDRDVVERIIRDFCDEADLKVRDKDSYSLRYQKDVPPTMMSYHADAIHIVVEGPDSPILNAKLCAEIQIRSSLTNTWADVQHTLVYKSEHQKTAYKKSALAPDSPVDPARDSSRLKGATEILDHELQRSMLELDRLDRYDGPLKTKEEHEAEYERWKGILKSLALPSGTTDPKLKRLAMRELITLDVIAGKDSRAKITAGQLLQEPDLTIEDRYAALLPNPTKDQVEDLRNHIKGAITPKGHNDPFTYMGRRLRGLYARLATLEHRHHPKDKTHSETTISMCEASCLSPHDPFLLAEEIHHLLRGNNPTAVVAAKRPLIEAAKLRCNRLIDEGLEVVRASFALARFHLLAELIDPESSKELQPFKQYCFGFGLIRAGQYIGKLSQLIATESQFITDLKKEIIQSRRVSQFKDDIEVARQGNHKIKRIVKASNELELIDAVIQAVDDQTLRSAIKDAKKDDLDSLQQVIRCEEILDLFKLLNEDIEFENSTLAMVIAGSTKADLLPSPDDFEWLLKAALKGVKGEGYTLPEFDGLVVSGGTESGICKICRKIAPDDAKLFGFPPSSSHNLWQRGVVKPPEKEEPYPSMRAVISYWRFLFKEKKINVKKITLLGFGGGPVSECEYALGTALGARVGILPQAKRSGLDMLKDRRWRVFMNLCMLVPDPTTFWFFVHRPTWQASARGQAVDQVRNRMAVRVHNAYVSMQERVEISKDANVDFNKLKNIHKDANLAQVDGMQTILDASGLEVVDDLDTRLPFDIEASLAKQLAELEHGRWNAFSIISGLWFNLERDRDKGFHSDLVPWKVLVRGMKMYDPYGEEVDTEAFSQLHKEFVKKSKAKDWMAIQAWPNILEDEGLKIVKK